MPKVAYRSHRFQPLQMAVAMQAVAITEEYAEQGFDLMLRRIFYHYNVVDGFLAERYGDNDTPEEV
jgi:hypothetical protein